MKTENLDNLHLIRRIDKSNMLSFCTEASEHYKKAACIANAFTINYRKPKTIIVAGMGGSAISGELLKDWARDKIAVPIEICREYTLPHYANENSLVFVTSYSGETEETLSAFLDAIKRKCMIICISSGGTLQEFAKKLGIPHLQVPLGIAPRASLPYMFMPLPILLEKSGLVLNAASEISETTKVLKQVSELNSPKKTLKENLAKKLASNIYGAIPVVYGFEFYRAVAQRLKTQFNENSKVPAKWEVFPELNHNEIVGWERLGKLAKYFSIIFIRDPDETKSTRQRIEATKALMQRKLAKIHEIKSVGKSRLAKMCSVICTGDFTSIYLAVMQGIDPTPVRSIDLVKKKMKQSRIKIEIISELSRIAKK